MNKSYIWAAIIILILAIGAILYSQKSGTAAAPTGAGVATYSYECDEHVTFTMTTSDDMNTIAIAPNGAAAAYPPAVTLTKQAASSGVRYTGGGVVFTAHGETVTLGEGDSAINCSPVQNPDMAPFNFGD